MRSIFFYLIIIMLTACNFNNKTNQDLYSGDNNIIMDCVFILGHDEITVEDMDTIAIRHKEIFKEDIDATIIESPQIKIEYFYGNYDDYIKNGKYFEDSFILDADNNKFFTTRELICKIHRQTREKINKTHSPHYFFEGLMFKGHEAGGMPVFEIMQGS